METRICCLFLILLLLSCSKKVMVQGTESTKLTFEPIRSILIHGASQSTGPCEPSISINHLNTKQIIAASVLDNFYVSNDEGFTWTNQKLKSTFGVYGDPVVRVNKDGDFLYAHLANSKGRAYTSDEFLDRIVVQKSTDLGKNWSNGSFPGVDHKKDHDKHWLYVDNSSGTVLMSWTEFDKYGSTDTSSKSRILFSKSTDGGTTWSDAISISQFEGDCLDGDKTTEGAHPAVGKDGAYYVTWSFNDKIYLDISKDGGLTWMDQDMIVTSQPGGWSFDIPGIGRCNGMPVMDVDHSGGPNDGTIYISWSDLSSGQDDVDIWLIRSSDDGKSWSDKVRVNNDKTAKHQFFSWMDIDQTTGYIYVVFYDRRNYVDEQTDVYLGYSIDGGKHFENIKISDSPFTPHPDVFFGDYNDISAHDGIIRPIWTSQDNDKMRIYTAIINVIK
ncbi:MAG: exo-alpha-sialidase [Saprospiraceae bacterium]|nr:exo-alpha-sialidase [Saprospiraceae bacterium]